MAFKRTKDDMVSIIGPKKEYFGSTYKFSKRIPFKVGSEAYVLLLGLDTGFFETPCHEVRPHKIDNRKVGFNGLEFAVKIKCKGIREDGTRDPEALCCKLAALEKERFPESEDAQKRVISALSRRIQLPVLILGNTVGDDSKKAYPVSKVSITKDLKSEKGLKFAYLDVATSTFKNDIIIAYGKKLKEEGVISYDLDEESTEFFETILSKLQNTIVKIRGVEKDGFKATLREYSFFPFENKNIACESGAGEREAIVTYKENAEIMRQVGEFLALFEQEVDNILNDWEPKYLQQYYNSATGAPLQANTEGLTSQKVELKEATSEAKPAEAKPAEATTDTKTETVLGVTEDGEVKEALPAEKFNSILNNPSGMLDSDLDVDMSSLEFDAEEDGDFFNE